MHTKFSLKNLNGRDHSDGLGTDGRLVDIQEIGYENNDILLIGPGLCPMATSFDHDNERSSFMKGEKILSHARDCNLLKMNSFPWNKLTVPIYKDGVPYGVLMFVSNCTNIRHSGLKRLTIMVFYSTVRVTIRTIKLETLQMVR
jgi:hypothetical protein